MKLTCSLPNLNRDTTSFSNFTSFQHPADPDDNDTTLNKRPKTNDTILNKRPKTKTNDTTLNKRPKSNDTEHSETSPFKGILSTSLSSGEMNENHHRIAGSAIMMQKSMTTAAGVRKPNCQKRAITFFRSLSLMRIQGRAQGSRPMSSPQLHHISERKRREKLNESFHALRSLLPLGTKKDKASVLASTTDYLASLKAQVEELTKRSRDLEEKVQLLATKKDHDQEVSLSPDQRLDVRITHEAESTSQARVIGLQLVLRGERNVMDLVTRILEFLRRVENASLLSVEADAQVVDSNPINIVRLRLRIEGGEWDESAFQEAVRRVVADIEHSDGRTHPTLNTWHHI